MLVTRGPYILKAVNDPYGGLPFSLLQELGAIEIIDSAGVESLASEIQAIKGRRDCDWNLLGIRTP
jgi:hypothetical protein